MKIDSNYRVTLAVFLCLPLVGLCAFAQAVPEQTVQAINGLAVTIKQVGPGGQEGPLQIACYLKHKPAGDKVIEALIDFDQHMGGMIKSLRDRGDFIGDERETIYFVPSPGSVKSKGILLIGLGDQDNLTFETMSRIGTVALREAVCLKASTVAYASTIKDQGIDKLEAGAVAGIVMKSVVLAYDTEKRLQKEGKAPDFTINQWIYEAGPAYYQSTVTQVREAVVAANREASRRSPKPFAANVAR
jgi:hypothetical protein